MPTDLITKCLKGKKRRNLAAARRVSLTQAGWTEQHQHTIKDGLRETITSSFRDRKKRACLFSDASAHGWAYVITQCDEEELEKPWEEQHHEILTVHSDKFSDTQSRWGMACKEVFPIRKAAELERSLLAALGVRQRPPIPSLCL